MPLPPLAIDPNEVFPHLSRAPITEAVIQISTRAEAAWVEANVLDRLKELLPDYPQENLQRGIVQSFTVHFGPDAPPVDAPPEEPVTWTGVTLKSADAHYVAKFSREAFSCSRLKPYEHWPTFLAETMRLWRIHREIAQPSSIQRVGLRFINAIDLPESHADLSDYLVNPPPAAHGFPLPMQGFVRHDLLGVPGHPYHVNYIQTIQPSPQRAGLAIIVDIDVFTVGETEPEQLEVHLAKMRWLKNKLFFGTVTEKALQRLR